MRLGRIHPQFRMFGTLTGRLAGSSGFSCHQQPKTEGYLSAWKPKPGFKWISVDFKSIEDVVLAEMSRDPALLKLYGPGASLHQDAYLFTGSKLPIIGEKILAAGYDENNPTRESIDKVKKECKRERQISKTCLAGDTLIRVKNNGWKEIKSIDVGDEVWDGIDWVKCDGVIFNGYKKVISYSGLMCTPDHQFLNDLGEWQNAELTPTATTHRPPSATWTEVWKLGSSIFYNRMEKWIQICRSKMPSRTSMEKL